MGTESTSAMPDIPMPEIVNKETFDTVEKTYDEKKEIVKDRVLLNFSNVRRVQSSGLDAMSAFSEKLRLQGIYVYIDHIDNAIFKALKISGKQTLFRFPHQGEYLSDSFESGGPRC